MQRNIVKYYTQAYDKLSDYSINFLLEFAGFKGLRVTEFGNGYFDGIYYGNNKNVDAIIIIPAITTDVIWKELIENKVRIDKIDKNIPFDIIGACTNFLTDRVNETTSEIAYDSHDRLQYSYSFQFINGIDTFPIVNRYAIFFRELLLSKFKAETIPLWPEGKKCCIGLSHDLDRPVKYQILRNFHYNNQWNLNERIYHTSRYFRNLMKWLTDKNKNDHWLINEVINEESKYNFKSTFFIASNNGYDRDGSIYDVFYDINWKEFSVLFEKMNSAGYEAALHVSYNAYRDEKKFSNEKHKLQMQAGNPIEGLRHHYWHMGKNNEDTLFMHEQCGFAYDSSIAFNDHIGFRRNAALPFYPFITKENRTINCLQLPVFLMDGNLFYKSIKIEQAINIISKNIETIKQYEGIGIIDWHLEASFPRNNKYFNWGNTYINLLKILSQDDIWVTSLADICSWVKKREKRING